MDDSFYVRVLKDKGFTVINSHLNTNQDFFTYLPTGKIDCIVSNPPFSKKAEILTRLYQLKIPFMMLLPQTSLQHKKLTKLFIENGVEYLGFDNRICFYTKQNLTQITNHNFFASGYFCHNVLPKPLMFEHIILEKESYFDSIK